MLWLWAGQEGPTPEESRNNGAEETQSPRLQLCFKLVFFLCLLGFAALIISTVAVGYRDATRAINLQLESLTLDNYNFSKSGMEGANWNAVFSLEHPQHNKKDFSFRPLIASIEYLGMPVAEGLVVPFSVSSINGTTSVEAKLNSTKLFTLLVPSITEYALGDGGGHNVFFDVLMNGWIITSTSRGNHKGTMWGFCEHVAIPFFLGAAPAMRKPHQCRLSD